MTSGTEITKSQGFNTFKGVDTPTTEPTISTNVFISYSRKDIAFVDRLAEALHRSGVTPSLDRSEIGAFEDWWKRIEALIRAADTVVFVISPDSTESRVCADEIRFALANNKRLAPIICRPVDVGAIPHDLSKLNFIAFDNPDGFDAALVKLKEGLTTDIDWVRKHTALGISANAWEEADRRSDHLLRGTPLRDAENWIAFRPRGAPMPTSQISDYIRLSRSATSRRKRYLLFGLVGALCISVGLTISAIWQSFRADRNFVVARDTANNVNLKLGANLRKLKGVNQETVLSVLLPTEDIVDEMVVKSGENPELRLIQARFRYEFGRTLWIVGDIRRALHNVDGSIAEVSRQLQVEREPGPRADLMTLKIDDLMLKGDIVRVLGQLDASREIFEQAADTARQLALVSVRSEDALLKQIKANGRIGDVYRTSGEFDRAQEIYGEILTTVEEQLSRREQSTAWIEELSWTHNRIGDNLLHIANHEGLMTISSGPSPTFAEPTSALALEQYRASAELRRGLLARDPNNKEQRQNLLWSLNLCAMAALAIDLKITKEFLDQAFETADVVLFIDPKNSDFQRYKSLTLNFLGDARLLSGQTNEALRAYEESLNIRRSLMESDTANSRWARDLFYTLSRSAQLSSIMGRATEADRFRTDALEFTKRIQAEFPRDSILQREVNLLAHLPK